MDKLMSIKLYVDITRFDKNLWEISFTPNTQNRGGENSLTKNGEKKQKLLENPKKHKSHI